MSEKSLADGRRQFLKGMAVTGAGAALATTVSATQAHEGPHHELEKKVGSQGYHETAHIREYYRKARF